MADAVIRSGGEMEPEQHQRMEKTSAGVLGVESNRAGAAEDTTQNGGRSESGTAGEALLVAAVAAEDKVPTNLSISSSSQRRSSISMANEQQQQPPSGVFGGPPPLPKPSEDQQPVRKNFQIPRKSREKKACRKALGYFDHSDDLELPKLLEQTVVLLQPTMLVCLQLLSLVLKAWTAKLQAEDS